MNLSQLDLNAVKRSLGKGIVFYANKWNPTTPLALTHLGDTEGDISIAPNAEVAMLTLPEVSGPAPHEADYTGEAPTIELPLYLADPSLMAVVSPSGSGSAGRTLRRAAKEYTLVVFPEALFIDDNFERATLAYAGGNWTLGGLALTEAQEELLATSLWFWRVVFNRPPRRFLGGAGDARKQIETVSCMVMHHPGLPEGHHLYTLGDPSLATPTIDLEGAS